MTKSFDPSLARLGDAIRKQRDATGRSQEAISMDAEIHRTYLSQLELGQRNPSYTVLLRLAKALHVRLTELLPEEDS